MTASERLIEAALHDAWLTLDEFCRLGAVTPQWVMDRIDQGLLPGPGGAPRAWRFDSLLVARVRCMARLERDFDAAPELAALVADLIDEIQGLRERLHRAGLD